MADRAWVLDLDGVVWRGRDAVPGAPEAVSALRSRGERLVFVTNSAVRTRAEVAAKLASHGIPDAHDQVITSAMAAAGLIEPGERVLACGTDGLVDELRRRDARVVTDGPIDAVVVGLHVDFDYEGLTAAMRAVLGGARLIAANDDPTYPASDGLLPGNGALVAAIERAGGRAAVVAGKPHQPMVDLVAANLGRHAAGVVVGDRPETDGRLATALGYDFVLVLSGVTGADDLPVEPVPRSVCEDLPSVVESWA